MDPDVYLTWRMDLVSLQAQCLCG